MAQVVKQIQVDQSYIPVDPKEFPHQLADASYAEQDTVKKILAYDGKNFLPTSYGYKSYFGTTSEMDFSALPSRVDHAICFQHASYANILIALCEDGIWYKFGEQSGDWFHFVTHVVEEDAPYQPWSYTVLYNDLYAYRQGHDEVWVWYANSADVPDPRPNPDETVVDFKGTITAAATANPYPTASYCVAFLMADGSFTQPTPWRAFDVDPATDKLTLTWQHPEDIDGIGYSARLFQKRPDGSIRYTTVEALTVVDPAPEYTRIINTSIIWLDMATTVGDTFYFQLPEHIARAPHPIYPQFLNMAGQIGIFSAGIRLGFWDAEDSISWSSIDDMTDFKPDVKTLAGAATFSDVVGRITTISAMRDGFVIYATKSIVLVTKDASSSYLWVPHKILDYGVCYPRQMCHGNDTDVHYAITTGGIMRIVMSNVEAILPEFYTLITKTQVPFYLTLLNNRYLMFSYLDENYELGRVRTWVDSVDAQIWTISKGSTATVPPTGDLLSSSGGGAGLCKTIAQLQDMYNTPGIS